MPAQLQSAGLKSRPPGTVGDGDYVLFCIACTDGPTYGTRQAVARCASRTIVPIAIVLTHYQLVDNESLRDLVTLEEVELLSRIMPSEEVTLLPLLYDFDPRLMPKILSHITRGPKAFICRTSEPR